MAMNTVALIRRRLFPKRLRGQLLILSAIILPIFFVGVSIAQRSGTSQPFASSMDMHSPVTLGDPSSSSGNDTAAASYLGGG